MASRVVAALLVGLLAVVQAQLWIGRGSVGDVAQMQQKLDEQKARNAIAQSANERLAAEVRDLREGLDMVEEKARGELGMHDHEQHQKQGRDGAMGHLFEVVESRAARVHRDVAEVFLDAQQLVVLGDAVAAAERTGLDLAGIGAHGDIGDRRVFGFA